LRYEISEVSGTVLASVSAMPKWKISDADAKAREAAFEAQVLAELTLAKQKPPAAPTPRPVAPVVPAPIIPAADGIQISLTAFGQTVRYDNLDSVPLPLRQQIMSTWLSTPQPGTPPVMTMPLTRAEAPAAPAPRPRSRRAAVVMNLFLPGAGQFYLGQPGWGSVYALGFVACLAPMIVIFSRAMQLAMSGDILEDGKLEKISELLQPGTIGILGALQIVIIIASIVHLFRSRPRA